MTARARLALLALLPCVSSWASHARADDTPVLGPRINDTDAVSFKPFADAKVVDKQSGSEVLRFENASKHWALSFARADLLTAQPLKGTPDEHGVPTVGFLSAAVNQLRSSSGTADVLRNEVIDLGDLPVGLLVAQVTDKNQPVLLQEVFIQISPKLYYSLAMTSPCPAKDIGNDPAVVEAGQTFKAIIDSIERVDLSAIRRDQDDRLYATRALFVNWSKKHLLEALQPERFLLFKRDGQPVGYAYVTEQPADALPKAGEVEKGTLVTPESAAGLRIGMRSHVALAPGKTVEAENWMYVSFDRRHEVWSSVSVIKDPDAKSEKDRETWLSEVGASDMRRERVFDSNLHAEDLKEMDQKNRDDKKSDMPFHEVDKYALMVRNQDKKGLVSGDLPKPITKDLPPFYIPEAIAMMLPRIVPLNVPTGYMFATYSSDNHQVMLRYLDVKPECDIKLNGNEYRAVPVVDRIGLHGDITTHYMTSAGVYLGSISEATKLEILPTDRNTLLTLFKNANLARPDAVKN